MAIAAGGFAILPASLVDARPQVANRAALVRKKGKEKGQER